MRSRTFYFFFIFLVCSFFIKATHNRAGEITYKRIAPFTAIVGGVTVQVYTYSITLIKYTDSGPNIADRCEDTIRFGDGQSGIAKRINGATSGCGCPTGAGCGVIILNDNGFVVKLSTYTITHTYPGPGTYTIRSLDPNRNGGVYNIPNSINIPFYVESILNIESITGANSSPLFNFAPIDRACAGVCFEHNPGAYDPDGDSLSFELTQSRGANGLPVPGYTYPESGSGGIYEINPITGLLRWCDPQSLGEYNIAFKVLEWRKNTSGVYQIIGSVLRDMQVIVINCNNSPPSITVPNICIEAGKTVTANLLVSDPDHGNEIKIQGGGGAFSAAPPVASFNPSSGTTNSLSSNSFNVFFTWNTTCDHIRRLPYQTHFKVQDNGNPNGAPLKLVSFNTFNIKVVPPSVKNVTATPLGTNMKISWDAAACSPTNNPLIGYKIYRKQDCTPLVLDPCLTGIPASSGFELIGTRLKDTLNFLDDNKKNGLVVGQDYSYIVVAFYLDGSESFGSSQVCQQLKRNVPVMLNVDVRSTSSSTGAIWVRWTKPLTDSNNLDTLTFPGPYKFILKHRSGASGNFNTLQSFTETYFAKIDTQYLHSPINSESGLQEYQVEFIADTIVIGSSQKASSEFLSITSSDRRIDLSWTSNTPWNKYKYSIMRMDSVTAPNFSLIANTTSTNYIDSTVINGSNYCYFIIREGQYSDPGIFKPLIDSSQIACAKPVDKTPPATPTITIDANCALGTVIVSWNDVSAIWRSDDVLKYTLYYKPVVDGVYTEIATINSKDPRIFQQDNINAFSGCYAIQAYDSNGNIGTLSQDFCIDNCPEFELPNVFSPNGDDINDFFKAIKVKQIKEIDLSVVDRWGHVVYTTKDPYFQWNGVSGVTKEKVSDGTFFYVCDVYEARLKGSVKRSLKGTVHVVR